MFIAAQFTIAKYWKKEILTFKTIWMDLKDAMLSEISQTEKDKYSNTIWYNLYVEYLKTCISESY